MSAIRSKNSKPELTVRRLVHGMGFRYRLHRRDLPGKPDLVFGPRRKVIFIHGCFWHQHPDPACLDGRLPKSRTEYWHAKLAKNVERDRLHCEALENSGWRVMTIWECETSATDVSDRLRAFLNDNTQQHLPLTQT
jgi:DNA mismatch endonuclease, patch repair protein